MPIRRLLLVACLGLLPVFLSGGARAEPPKLKVAVLEDSPPLGYRDADGNLTGFSYALAQAVCVELNAQCEFEVTKLDYLVEDLAAGHFDLAAVGLLNTPERRQKILFTQPVYRSVTMWFAKPGVHPGQAGVRVSVFKGSAQERYAQAQGWSIFPTQTDLQMVEQLVAGVAHVAMVPLMTSLNLHKNRKFLQLGLQSTVLQVPELIGNACFGINPRRGELKGPVDEALEKIKRNGTYDRINSVFLPFRVM